MCKNRFCNVLEVWQTGDVRSADLCSLFYASFANSKVGLLPPSKTVLLDKMLSYRLQHFLITCTKYKLLGNPNKEKIPRNFKNFVSEKSYVSCPTSHESTINTYNAHRHTFTNKHKTHIHSHKHTQIHELGKFPICKRERRSTKAIVKRSFSFIHKWAYVLDNVCAEASIIQGTKWTLRFCCEFECR